MPTIVEVAEFLGDGHTLRWLGPRADHALRGPAPLDRAGAGELSFCAGTARDPAGLLAGARAAVVVVDRAIVAALGELPPPREDGPLALIEAENARLSFLRVVRRFFAPRPAPGVHPSAVVAPTARLGAGVHVGPLATVGDGVEVGDGSVIHAGVHLYPGVRVGRRVVIHSGTVVGADGFGYERNEAGELEKFPHVGGVRIEDDVEIGANTCIDRGTLDDTVIGARTRVDNLVHVAHNIRIGEDCAVIAHAMLGGSVRIGDRSWIAPSACVRDRLVIGADATVGLGALVTRDVGDGETVMGAPARVAAEYKTLLRELSRLATAGGGAG